MTLGVEAAVSVSEINDLSTRFLLIKHYEQRYKVSVVLAGMARSYMPNLKRTASVFDPFLLRIIGRIDRTAAHNNMIRHLLFSQGLEYDLEPVTVPDGVNGSRVVSFSHGMLMVSKQ
jgi:hypothetical protein